MISSPGRSVSVDCLQRSYIRSYEKKETESRTKGRSDPVARQPRAEADASSGSEVGRFGTVSVVALAWTTRSQSSKLGVRYQLSEGIDLQCASTCVYQAF